MFSQAFVFLQGVPLLSSFLREGSASDPSDPLMDQTSPRPYPQPDTSPDQAPPSKMATVAVGTHPAGMHSCCL